MNTQHDLCRSLAARLRGIATQASLGLTLGLLAPAAMSAPLQLHVSGNQVQDSNNVNVRLQGVNIPSLEWSNAGENISTSQGVAHGTWKASIIRLPLSQDRWFGHASGQSDGGAAYKAIVDGVVNTASSGGYYVLLDCHWSDEGVWGANMAQHPMPDDNSTTFWNDCATRYKNNPAVLFDLYNEPHDVAWSVWRNGGNVTDTITYHSPGLQGLLNTIRNTGANNVVVAGGLDWAYDLTGVSGNALTDTGSGKGIVYAAHIYPWKGPDGGSWDPKVTVAAGSHPILIGECGADTSSIAGWTTANVTTWCNTIISWMNSHGYNWTGWSFHPSAGPAMLADWNYNTTTWGAIAKTQLTSSGPVIPPVPTGLTASAGNSQVSLSWNASSGATAYDVKRSTVSGSGYATVSSPTTTSYTNTGLTNGTTYYFVVDAKNSAGTSGNSTQASATPTAGGTSGVIKINAGGPAASPFVADTDFSGGTTATNWTGTIDTSAVTSPAPQAVYQSERYSSPAMSYTIGGLTAGTTYTVRLHFCENYFTASGLRKFSVAINGTTVLTNFDIFATTGAIHKATCQQFNVAANGSGQEVITFTNVTNNALINGIEVNSSGGGSGNTHGGTWSGKAVLTTTAGFTNMFQVANCAANSTYVGSIWLKGSGSLELAVKAGNWGADIKTMQCNATSTWTQYTLPSFSTGSNTQLTFVLQDQYGGTAGTVYIDDGFLGVSAGTNILANAGFESGATTWSTGTAFSIGQF